MHIVKQLCYGSFGFLLLAGTVLADVPASQTSKDATPSSKTKATKDVSTHEAKVSNTPTSGNAKAAAAAINVKDAFGQEVRRFVEQLARDNTASMKDISKAHLTSFVEDQNPRATVVSCSDSRVQAESFHQNPINDLFFIRNIGNQIQSTEGSVEYGVNHLKTPILLIIGHSQCGAIHAAMGDYSKLSKPIKKELDNLDLIKGNDTDEGVIANIHNQVNHALNKFKDKINNKELVVIGLLYDFRDDFGHGHGKMIVLDVNGETDMERLKTLPLLEGVSGIAIGDHHEAKTKP